MMPASMCKDLRQKRLKLCEACECTVTVLGVCLLIDLLVVGQLFLTSSEQHMHICQVNDTVVGRIAAFLLSEFVFVQAASKA